MCHELTSPSASRMVLLMCILEERGRKDSCPNRFSSSVIQKNFGQERPQVPKLDDTNIFLFFDAQ